jgi:hypothetical protein
LTPGAWLLLASTQNPVHQSADFSAKQGVTPGGNDLELFLGQS